MEVILPQAALNMTGIKKVVNEFVPSLYAAVQKCPVNQILGYSSREYPLEIYSKNRLKN